MGRPKKSKLATAMAQAVVGEVSADTKGLYDWDDPLKHYIRRQYWLKRIKKLQRDSDGRIDQGIKYFSFCSQYALDVRMLIQEGIINVKEGDYSTFCYVESEEGAFRRLDHWRTVNRELENSRGVLGKLAEVATNTKGGGYGEFWSWFPFDVVNLDYLGDIFKASRTDFGSSDFFAIEAIVNRQASLRRPYELWVTMRAKDGRLDEVVKSSFREILGANIQENEKFKTAFETRFPQMKVGDLDNNDLFLYGFLKWLWHVCSKAYSVIEMSMLDIISYTRKDKDGKPYLLYNVLLRIKPFGPISFPSHVGEAAKHCWNEYKAGTPKTLKEPKNIDDDYKKLAPAQLRQLKDELAVMKVQYDEDFSSYLGR